MAKRELNLSRQEKVNYLRIALSLQQVGINVEIAERVVATYERILEIGGEFSVDDAVDIELCLDKKYTEKRLKEKN